MNNSAITPSVNLDLNNWAVTLICDRGGKCKSNHARLLFEGIKVSGYFSRIAHLINGENGYLYGLRETGVVIFNREINKNTLIEMELSKFEKKSVTWQVTKEKIECLFHNINLEAKKPYPFIFFGSRSILAKEAEVYDIHEKLLLEIGKKDKGLFLQLYDSAKNESKCTGRSESNFNKALEKVLTSIKKDFPDIVIEDVKNYDFKKVIGFFTDEIVRKDKLMQQNCFTWCRNHLKSIGIELEDGFVEKMMNPLISRTRNYAIHKINENGEGCSIKLTSDKMEIKSEKNSDGRLITYEIKRDKRTESYKEASQEIQQNEIVKTLGITTGVVGAIGIDIGVGVGVAAFGFGVTVFSSPVVLPVAAAVSVVGGAVVVGGGIYAMAKSIFKLGKIKYSKDHIENKKKEITAIEFKQYEQQINKIFK